MATFSQILVNFIVGCFIFIGSISLFGGAVRFQYNKHLAPRTWSRPIEVIKNVLRKVCTARCGCGCSCYGFGWYVWALRLSYAELLDGIPGTGTRNNGYAGPKLKTNLDGIIMLKFHKFLMKVCCLCMILCMVVLFPAYIEAECEPKVLGEGTCDPIEVLNDFESSTIAHLPPFDFNATGDSNSTLPPGLTDDDITDGIPRKFFVQHTNLLWRYILIVIVAFIIYGYTCYLLKREWIENVALRRVYYLEFDHYEERLMELEDLVDLDREHKEIDFQKTRPPWLPHPELRETPPDIATFSALYKLPKKIVTTSTSNSENSTTTELEKQLCSTVEFFDECVPNQPGYSSSVAAVTILPDGNDVTDAWLKWYGAAGKLRKLRFIRSIISKKRLAAAEKRAKEEDEIVVFNDDEQNDDDALGVGPREINSSSKKQDDSDDDDDDSKRDNTHPTSKTSTTTALKVIDEEEQNADDNDVDEQANEQKGGGDGGDDDDNKTIDVEQDPQQQQQQSEEELHSNAKSILKGDMTTATTTDNEKEEESAAAAAPAAGSSAGGKEEMKSLLSELSFVPNSNNNNDIENENNEKCLEPSIVVSPGGGITAEYSNDDDDDDDTTMKPLLSSSQQDRKNEECDRDVVFDEKKVEEKEEEKAVPKQLFLYSDFKSQMFARQIGIVQEYQDEYENGDHLDGLGIEQLSVYAREYAQNSSNACPFGFAQSAIKFSKLDKLIEMEERAQKKYEIAIKEWDEARERALDKISGDRTTTADHDDNKEMRDQSQSLQKQSSDIEEGGGGGGYTMRKRIPMSERWREAELMAQDIRRKSWSGDANSDNKKAHVIRSGWAPLRKLTESDDSKMTTENTKNGSSFLAHPTYAVVTFTSRQAAVAARQCMMDGGGLDHWSKVDELPVAPLADAPPRNIFFCRGFCRPVSLTISDDEKRFRTCSVNTFFLLFSLTYTIPLALTSQLLDPTQLAIWFPDVDAFSDPDNFFFQFLSGLSSGIMYTLFFSFCPQFFKAMAFYKGNASSIAVAEDNALEYYWIFMLLTAFTGTSLATMVFSLFSGVSAGDAIKEVLRQVALAIPTQQAPVWLNWIVVRFTYTLPFLYLFQFNTFAFAVIRWPWCNRVMRGGGPGGPPPYRIYIDGATVFLCAVGLGPQCPFITPFAFAYFCVMNPMLRWLLIFVYRPKYDSGGKKWPILHEVVISTLIVSQVLLSAQLFLKYAYWAALLVFVSIWPTYAFGAGLKRDFGKQYQDAGLLQTSKLDGWDTERSTSRTKREEYRRWLVDCHKASYVPLCLAASDCILTSEPCAVIPTNRDVEEFDRNGVLQRQSAQRGALFRRERSNYGGFGVVDEEKSTFDPFSSIQSQYDA